MSSKPQLYSLTGLRFFLALWVVVYHQTGHGGFLEQWVDTVPERLFCFLRTGYLAVGIFFVLSGFVLSYSYPLVSAWSKAQIWRFGVARFARIYPAYAIGLLLISPFVAHGLWRNFSAGEAARAAFSALAHWTLLQSWIPQAALLWNAPGWSLSDEAFFYACFPLVGVVLWRLSNFRSILATSVAVWGAALLVPVIVVAIPLAGLGDVPATSLQPNADLFWANFMKFNPLIHLPDFCFGILAARIYRLLRDSGNSFVNRGYRLYLPGIVAELLVIAFGDKIPFPLFHNGLLLPLHALVILGFSLGGGALDLALSYKPLIFLGNASYSMYILHAPLAVWLHGLIKLSKHSRFATPLALTGVYVAIVIGLASVVFKLVEEPANRFLKDKLNSLVAPPIRASATSSAA